MILIVTNRCDHTADFLILELQRRGVAYYRFNTEDLPDRAEIDVRPGCRGALGVIRSGSKTLPLSDVSSVWYRRPGTPTPSPTIADSAALEFCVTETQAALDGMLGTLNVFWISHPHMIRRAEQKLLQLRLATSLGFAVPNTLVTNSPESAREFLGSNPSVIYKPMRRGRITTELGNRIIFTNLVSGEARARLDSISFAPCLLQEYVPKAFEVRVTVIGKLCFAVAIHSQDGADTKIDWRRGEPRTLRHEIYGLPDAIRDRCVKLVEMLGLSFGAIDLIVRPDGAHVFLEINPNGQWAWLEQLCPDLPLRASLADLLCAGGHGVG